MSWSLQGNVVLDSEMMAELVASAVGEIVYENVWNEGTEILGWTFDIPEVVVHYSVDVEFNDED